jgi:hypothetical protein
MNIATIRHSPMAARGDALLDEGRLIAMMAGSRR